MSPDELRDKLIVIDLRSYWMRDRLLISGRVLLLRQSGLTHLTNRDDVTLFTVSPWPLIFTGFDRLSKSASERLLLATLPTAENAGINDNIYQISGNDRVLFELLERA